MALQMILFAATVLLVGALVVIMARRRGNAPQAITDPYQELYSDLRGEVVARPLGEPSAGVSTERLQKDDRARWAELDTVEFAPVHLSPDE
jgi:hypothetical protein